MDFTGERFLPEIKGEISHEHRHRYAICRQFVAGRRVLDAACGEGYGSNILAGVASEVVGIDIDPETISHATSKYRRPGLSFEQGDCRSLSFPVGSFDVVVSLETIEHMADPERFLAEARRVLRPDGALIVSTPNRTVSSATSHQKNRFHHREFTIEEFSLLLNPYFHSILMLGQRLCLNSVVGEIHTSETWKGHAAYSATADGLENCVSEIRNPKYLIAICASQEPVAQ